MKKLPQESVRVRARRAITKASDASRALLAAEQPSGEAYRDRFLDAAAVVAAVFDAIEEADCSLLAELRSVVSAHSAFPVPSTATNVVSLAAWRARRGGAP